MILAIILLVLAVLALIGTTAYFAIKYAESERDLNSIIAGLAAENSLLQGQQEVMETLVEALQERVTLAETFIPTGSRYLN